MDETSKASQSNKFQFFTERQQKQRESERSEILGWAGLFIWAQGGRAYRFGDEREVRISVCNGKRGEKRAGGRRFRE